MAWRLELSPAARRDLSAIENYLAERTSAATVSRQMNRIIQLIDRIVEAPLVFAIKPALGEDIRLATSRPYVVIFTCGASKIEVLRVAHGARDLPAVLREPS